MEGFSLNAFVLWLISGGATVVVRLIVARIPTLQKELSEGERSAVSMLFSVILIGAAFMGAVYAEYVPEPQTSLEWFEALFVPVATALGIPALMTTTMQVKEARYEKKYEVMRASSYPGHDRLFGIRW